MHIRTACMCLTISTTLNHTSSSSWSHATNQSVAHHINTNVTLHTSKFIPNTFTTAHRATTLAYGALGIVCITNRACVFVVVLQFLSYLRACEQYAVTKVAESCMDAMIPKQTCRTMLSHQIKLRTHFRHNNIYSIFAEHRNQSLRTSSSVNTATKTRSSSNNLQCKVYVQIVDRINQLFWTASPNLIQRHSQFAHRQTNHLPHCS